MLIDHVSSPIPSEYTAPNLGYLSTEKINPITAHLSEVMHSDCIGGLQLLQAVDEGVLAGFQTFASQYLDVLKSLVQARLSEGGRCFLVGSGTSGRIAIDLAAKTQNSQVIGVLAGGDSAFICAREGFEDSENDGRKAIQSYRIQPKDIIFLISASGSASFNRGCAKEASQAGATVCYFYNSAEVPPATQRLFGENNVYPILVDIGPQAITGSTRLQAATLAELCLGCLLTDAEPKFLVESIKEGNQKIKENLQQIAAIVQLETQLFSDPQANFRRLKDETQQGYVTFLSEKDCLREIIMDAVEIAPTFSTNPPRAVEDHGKKQAEFQAFLIEEQKNEVAWKTVLGREVYSEEVLHYDLSENGLKQRPLGKGNLIIGVAKEDPTLLVKRLKELKQQGAYVALITLGEATTVPDDFDAVVGLSHLKNDKAGIVKTIMAKQVLNMISNGSMILMNKVDGNRMVDVSPSNKKLIDRATRLVQDLLYDHKGMTCLEVNAVVKAVSQLRKECESYTPSTVKIAVTMIYRHLSFTQAVEFLRQNQESLEKVFIL